MWYIMYASTSCQVLLFQCLCLLTRQRKCECKRTNYVLIRNVVSIMSLVLGLWDYKELKQTFIGADLHVWELVRWRVFVVLENSEIFFPMLIWRYPKINLCFGYPYFWYRIRQPLCVSLRIWEMTNGMQFVHEAQILQTKTHV